MTSEGDELYRYSSEAPCGRSSKDRKINDVQSSTISFNNINKPSLFSLADNEQPESDCSTCFANAFNKE